MVNFRQFVKQTGGTLVLCGMSPRLAEIFRTCSLDRLFKTVPTRELAVKALS
jgi:anti-anti-sigma regulatory factor